MELSLDDWAIAGDDIPLLVNLMPAGAYLGEDYYHAGGVPAVIAELIRHDRIRSSAMTVNGKTIGENCGTAETISPDVIRTFETGLKPAAGIAVIRGNFFDSAVMKSASSMPRSAIATSPIQMIRTPSEARPPYLTDRKTIIAGSTIRPTTSTKTASS